MTDSFRPNQQPVVKSDHCCPIPISRGDRMCLAMGLISVKGGREALERTRVRAEEEPKEQLRKVPGL